MDLTISEAATLLGRSPRQLRYLIRQGKLEARKKGTRWVIASDDLPLTEEQRANIKGRINDVRHHLEQAITPLEKGAEPSDKEKKETKQFSVTDFRAFQAGESIYRKMTESLSRDDETCRSLFEALCYLIQGCHAFHPKDKSAKFAAARESAAVSIAHLLLQCRAETEAIESNKKLAQRIEQELIPKLSRLIATHERRSRKTRFASFGSSFGQS